MFYNKKKTGWEKIREGASECAHNILQQAQESASHAPETLDDLKDNAGEVLGDVGARMHDALGSATSAISAKSNEVKADLQLRARKAQRHGGKKLADWRDETEGEWRDKADALRSKTSDSLHETLEGTRGLWDRRVEDAAAQLNRVKSQQKQTEVEVSTGSEKWLWLGVGVLVGAAIGVLLAPSSGRRNRALLRDKAVKGAHKASDLGEAATRRAHDLSNRAQGVASGVASRVAGNSDDEIVDDATIADRVRTELGRLPAMQDLERLNIDSCEGVVTLRGPVVDDATQAAIIAAVEAVRGVREVKSDLLVESEDDQAFVG